MFKKGVVSEVEEDLSLDMFSIMIDELSKAGFDHYEISNFAKENLYSKHNTAYWQGERYLGLGAAAHSFDGKDRELNIASISQYINGVQEAKPKIEVEILGITSQYNDFVLTGMRTKWGIDLKKLEKQFGTKFLKFCLQNAQKHIHLEDVINEDSTLKLTKKGIFISDGIMSDLMWV